MSYIADMEIDAGTQNGTTTELRLADLEGRVETLTWLLAEKSQQVMSLATAMGALLAQQLQPQVQQQVQQMIADRLLGTAPGL